MMFNNALQPKTLHTLLASVQHQQQQQHEQKQQQQHQGYQQDEQEQLQLQLQHQQQQQQQHRNAIIEEERLARRATCHHMKWSQIELIYRAEGNANLVLALPQFKKVLRLPKMQPNARKQNNNSNNKNNSHGSGNGCGTNNTNNTIINSRSKSTDSTRRAQHERKQHEQHKYQQQLEKRKNEKKEMKEMMTEEEQEHEQQQHHHHHQLKDDEEEQQEQSTSAMLVNQHQSAKVENLTMEHFAAYIEIIRWLLGNEFIFEVDIIHIPHSEDKAWINEHINPSRPVHRRDKEFCGQFGLLLPDATILPTECDALLTNLQANAAMSYKSSSDAEQPSEVENSSYEIFAIEIKPKQGWLLPTDVNDLFDILSTTTTTETMQATDSSSIKMAKEFHVGCRYCAMQYLKLQSGKVNKLSGYCPIELFSGVHSRMSAALAALFECPQNNLRIYRNSELIYGDHKDSLSFLELRENIFKGVELELIKHLLLTCLLRDFEEPLETMKTEETSHIATTARNDEGHVAAMATTRTTIATAMATTTTSLELMETMGRMETKMLTSTSTMSTVVDVEQAAVSVGQPHSSATAASEAAPASAQAPLPLPATLRMTPTTTTSTTTPTTTTTKAKPTPAIEIENPTTETAIRLREKATTASKQQAATKTTTTTATTKTTTAATNIISPATTTTTTATKTTPTATTTTTSLTITTPTSRSTLPWATPTTATPEKPTTTITPTTTPEKPTTAKGTRAATTRGATVLATTPATTTVQAMAMATSTAQEADAEASTETLASPKAQTQINEAEMLCLPKNCVLQKILNLQLLAKNNLRYLLDSGTATKSIKTYKTLETLLQKHFHSKTQHLSIDELTPAEQYLLGATALDCSIMITFQKLHKAQLNLDLIDEGGKGGRHFVYLPSYDECFLVKVTLLDLDPKPDSHLHKYVKQTKEAYECLFNASQQADE